MFIPSVQQHTFSFKGLCNIQVDLHIAKDSQYSLILLPALGVPISKYSQLIALLVENNINTVTADYPGCGRNIPEVSRHFNYSYADLLQHFIPELINTVKQYTHTVPVLLGHSLGGHLATLYAQQHHIAVIGVATGNIGLRNWDFKGKLNILKAASVINLMLLKDGYLAGYKIGFGHKEARHLMKDWSRTIFTGNYRHIQQIETLSENPALFIQLKNDDFAPLSSTQALSRYFKHPVLKVCDLTQQLKGNQHSVWIKQPETIIQLIQQWLKQMPQG